MHSQPDWVAAASPPLRLGITRPQECQSGGRLYPSGFTTTATLQNTAGILKLLRVDIWGSTPLWRFPGPEAMSPGRLRETAPEAAFIHQNNDIMPDSPRGSSPLLSSTMTPTWWRLVDYDTCSQPQKQVYVCSGGNAGQGGNSSISKHCLLTTQRAIFFIFEDH